MKRVTLEGDSRDDVTRRVLAALKANGGASGSASLRQNSSEITTTR
jgi:hypothetical protein